MHKKYLPQLCLLITAMIWGFAFVAQSSGMDHLGPFFFNGIRFLIGAAVLVPIVLVLDNRKKIQQPHHNQQSNASNQSKHLWIGGLCMGIVLFMGASLQQIGIQYTHVANAGFITSLYIILVPLIGLFFGHRTNKLTWFGAILALVGLFLLSVTEQFTISTGDLLQLAGAVFWAMHILVIAYFSPKASTLKLCIIQFFICGIISLIIGVVFEDFSLLAIQSVIPQILYLAILSTGVAYTIQVFAQKHVPPANAAIIFSLESVFALLGGWLLLNETLGTKELLGCGLMFIGVLISQYKPRRSSEYRLKKA